MKPRALPTIAAASGAFVFPSLALATATAARHPPRSGVRGTPIAAAAGSVSAGPAPRPSAWQTRTAYRVFATAVCVWIPTATNAGPVERARTASTGCASLLRRRRTSEAPGHSDRDPVRDGAPRSRIRTQDVRQCEQRTDDGQCGDQPDDALSRGAGGYNQRIRLVIHERRIRLLLEKTWMFVRSAPAKLEHRFGLAGNGSPFGIVCGAGSSHGAPRRATHVPREARAPVRMSSRGYVTEPLVKALQQLTVSSTDATPATRRFLR